MLSGYLQLSGGNGLSVGVDSVYAQGRLTPMLRMSVEFQTPQGRRAELVHLVAAVSCRDEHLGRGEVFGGFVNSGGYQAVIDIPTTRRHLDYVTAALGSASSVELQVKWSGRVRFGLEEGATRSVMSEPEPGHWSEGSVQSGMPCTVQVSRSDWYERVMAPTRAEDYVYLEVAIPRGAGSAKWRQSLSHLTRAEAAFAHGDDAAVFGHLRAALDALPGAKKNIFDSVPEPKRERVDAIVHEVGQFLHLGRHVTAVGADAGAFPVDRLDAEYALAQMKVLFSYASRLLARTNTT